MADEALLAQLGQRGERLLERAFGGAVDVEHAAQVHHVQHINPQVTQVTVDGFGQFITGEGGEPRAALTTPRAHLGHDHQIFGVRMQRFTDQLIGHVRAVKITGVDVIDAAGDCFAQDGERARSCTRIIAGWTPPAAKGDAVPPAG